METLIEPSLFVYGGVPLGTFERVSFDAFYATLKELSEACELNDLCIRFTPDLSDAVSVLFPFRSMHSQSVSGPAHGAARLALTIIEKHAHADRREYGDADAWVSAPPLKRPGVYADEDLWLGWTDLLHQLCHGATDSRLRLVRPESSLSCLTSDQTAMTQGDRRVSVEATPLNGPSAKILAPATHRELIKKKPAHSAIVFEDSGHQPSAAIKAVLARTARRSECVSRAGTTWRNPSMVETCKLSDSDREFEIGFRISDGTECTKGFFRTTATTAEEQAVARILVERAFRETCINAGFSLDSSN